DSVQIKDALNNFGSQNVTTVSTFPEWKDPDLNQFLTFSSSFITEAPNSTFSPPRPVTLLDRYI
ncbi:MAG: hypothetical protein EZS28_039235, partial [Streblomastix strix]